MALSQHAKNVLIVAMASRSAAGEISAAIDAASAFDVQAAHVAPVATANATDLATAEALANANKVAINALIASLIAAGLMAAS